MTVKNPWHQKLWTPFDFFWVCLFKASGELGVAFDVLLQLWQLSDCNLQKTVRSTKYLWRSSKTPKKRQQTKYSQCALQLQNIIHYSMYKMNSRDHYCWHNTTLHVSLWRYCSWCSYFLIAKQNHQVCRFQSLLSWRLETETVRKLWYWLWPATHA